MATHSTILAWEIPWTEEPGWLQPMGFPKSQTQLSTAAHTRCIGRCQHFVVIVDFCSAIRCNSCALLKGVQIGTVTMENSREIPQKIKSRTTIWSIYPTSEYLPKEYENINLKRYFIAALFTIANMWKWPKCLPVSEWIKKLWFIYTMEYYSAIKRQNLAICINMDGPEVSIMFSQINQRNSLMCEI